MTTFHIILASTSKARIKLLKDAKVPFRSLPPGVDEGAVKESLAGASGVNPESIATSLAKAKAERVSSNNFGNWVIGADQILEQSGRIFDKPHTYGEARAQLLKLRGKTHKLISAVAVARNGSLTWASHTTAELSMRNFTDEFLTFYLKTAGKDVLDSVGAYKIEGLGVQLFDRIEGDYFTILGLPLLHLLAYLRSQGCLKE